MIWMCLFIYSAIGTLIAFADAATRPSKHSLGFWELFIEWWFWPLYFLRFIAEVLLECLD